MLRERFTAAPLLARAAWRPYPPIDDRGSWDRVPDSARRGVIAAARATLGQPWETLPATGYLAYVRTGDRAGFEKLYFARRARLALLAAAECLENRGELLDAILDGAWLVCEETSWCVPAHLGAQRAGHGLPDRQDPVIDLFAAETGAALAWTAYLLGPRLDAVSPLVTARIRAEVDARLIAPLLARDDFWWMGFTATDGRPNNWNPWVNSNLLAAGCLLEEDAARRAAIVEKCMRSLDTFLDPYPRDGGCDEGPSYWSRAAASVYDCLETLDSVSGGRISAWNEPLLAAMARYILSARIAGRWYVNFADAPAVVTPPAGVVYGFGKKLADEALKDMGATLDAWEWDGAPDELISPERLLRELFLAREMESRHAAAPSPRDTWLPEIQVMASRDAAGSSAGLFLAAKGGHNGESHNHNDVGSFLVFHDGRPLVVDVGVGVYTSATFDPDRRYGIWTMQSAYHTLLPVIDGVMQAEGRDLAASSVMYEATAEEARLSLEMSGAYPAAAGLASWRRSLVHRRGREVVVTDDYRLARQAGEMTLSFVTACRVSLRPGGRVVLHPAPLPGGRSSARGEVRLVPPAGARCAYSVERIPLDDARLCASWGSELRRVVIRCPSPAVEGRWSAEIRARS